jgi:hypothetical protein
LIVEAEHQGWMQLLQLDQDRILAEIQRRFPELEIRGIGFRLAKDGPEPEASRTDPDEVPKPVPVLQDMPSAEDSGEERLVGDAGRGALTPELKVLFGKIRKNVARNEGRGPGGRDTDG